tara:strand:+ start:1193 stop:1414 length:222 start_codon:yes stop_codon:yes gene_type:complete
MIYYGAADADIIFGKGVMGPGHFGARGFLLGPSIGRLYVALRGTGAPLPNSPEASETPGLSGKGEEVREKFYE